MIWQILAFFVGHVALLSFTQLPNTYALLFLFSICLVITRLAKGNWSLIFYCVTLVIIGLMWSTFNSRLELMNSLRDDLEGKSLVVEGYIDSLPKKTSDNIIFDFKTIVIDGHQKHLKIRLNWYKQHTTIRVGDRWRLLVRLKQPRGTLNPGGFDYEKLLFQQKIRATGYVVSNQANQLLEKNNINHSIDRLRQYLQTQIEQILANQEISSVIVALAIGVNTGINSEQWQIFRSTGTNHLVAIAGLHIGFVSGLIYGVTQFLWRRITFLSLWMPTSQAAIISALITAFFYSALAGFALPTVRALIMMAVFTLTVLLRRNISVWNTYLLALLVILILMPLDVLSVGFWLSFGAVGLIIYGISGRINQQGLWWKWGRVQWIMALGLVPFLLLLFQQASLISFIANSVAIPGVGFFVLPLTLLGSLFLLIFKPLGILLLGLAAKLMTMIWLMLTKLANLQYALWYHAVPNMLSFFTSIAGILLLLSPRGIPGKWLGSFWLLPLFFYKPVGPQVGQMWFTLLDVGQGLASIVRTQHHLLVFDTGAKTSADFDMGQAVVLPYLRMIGITKVDVLVISHGDNDHIGGANSIITNMPVSQILTSIPQRFSHGLAQYCYQGQQWQWDGIFFQVLSPPQSQTYQDNNSSCVLRISDGKNSILLTGDIEKGEERVLLAQSLLLPTTLLVAPHHGSKTSSTQSFVELVHPHYVLFPIGYRNRYHFPNPIVVKRYHDVSAELEDSVQDGAITFKFDQHSGVISHERYRQEEGHFWNQK